MKFKKFIKMIVSWFEYVDSKRTEQLTDLEEIDRCAGSNYWL